MLLWSIILLILEIFLLLRNINIMLIINNSYNWFVIYYLRLLICSYDMMIYE